MSFRQVLISKKCYVHYDNNNMKIEDENDKLSVPISDIAIVIFESTEISISTRLLSELSKNNITVLYCGYNHMPVSYSLPINNHYRLPYVHKLQMEQSIQMKEYVAEVLIKYKLDNTVNVLKILNFSEEVIEKIEKYRDEIIGFDDLNREGTAAKVFFNNLYGIGFSRKYDSDTINMALNYGYGVFRSAITRLLCSYGLTTYIGVKHNSIENAFNLTYDFIEPFRPIIDYYIKYHLYKFIEDNDLTSDIRKELICLLNAKVKCLGKECTVLYSMEMLIKNYISFLEDGLELLAIPNIIKIDFNDLFNEL